MSGIRHLGGISIRGVAVAALIGGVLVGAAAPASASITGFNNGPIGITQTITIDVTPNTLGQPICTMRPTINGVLQQAVTGALVNSTATFLWTPQGIGAATFSLTDCSTTSTIPAVSITQVSTITVISGPDTAQVGVPTQINVTVQAASPSSYAPTGQVVVRDPASGAIIVTMGLTRSPNANGQSFAFWRWTPPSVGAFTFQATYSGDANASVSTSPVDVIGATQSGNTISLTAPATVTQGVPVQLSASVFPSNSQGSAGFTFNGAPISASVPFVNGVSKFLWTPTTVGAGTLGVNYMTNGGRSGNTTSAVNVVAGPQSVDRITLVQPGFGPWNPNGVYTLGNGSQFAFQTSTLSGAPVTLSETGPCNLSGQTLVIDTGFGQCNLVASSAGGPGYAPVSQGYTISMVPGVQTARLAAPQSGNFNRGRTIRLQNPVQGATNAEQNISWRVTRGASRCEIRYPRNGAVNLRLVRNGQCTVVGTADAVPNGWQPFAIQRTYTAR
jgi:hypothetical protein